MSTPIESPANRCFVCGPSNPIGLHLQFRIDGDVCRSEFTPGDGHMGYQGLTHGGIPNDPELPLPLSKVHPIHEVVKIDYFLPGCPPSANRIQTLLVQVLEGVEPKLEGLQLKFG